MVHRLYRFARSLPNPPISHKPPYASHLHRLPVASEIVQNQPPKLKPLSVLRTATCKRRFSQTQRLRRSSQLVQAECCLMVSATVGDHKNAYRSRCTDFFFASRGLQPKYWLSLSLCDGEYRYIDYFEECVQCLGTPQGGDARRVAKTNSTTDRTVSKVIVVFNILLLLLPIIIIIVIITNFVITRQRLVTTTF